MTGGRTDHTWAQYDVGPAIGMHDAVEYFIGTVEKPSIAFDGPSEAEADM